MYSRKYLNEIIKRLKEKRSFIQAITGPRQVGKTTLIQQALKQISCKSHYISADEPTLRDQYWLAQQWETTRRSNGTSNPAVLVIDEVHKIENWHETVKRLWDEDSMAGRNLHIVLLGSAPLLFKKGLSESLSGRFEMIRLPHWSYPEMKEAFGFTLEQFLYYGGYPGSAQLIDEPERWKRYICDSLIETTIGRDVLLTTRVDKPALLRRLFELACLYSGQIVSYQKLQGRLQDAGNTTTLAHYLDLLSQAGMVAGLQKYSGSQVRRRNSSPKLQVFNTALMTAQSDSPFEQNPESKGRLTESAVGAFLANRAFTGRGELYYWRKAYMEVDFIFCKNNEVFAIEVKSGSAGPVHAGTAEFAKMYSPDHILLVGEKGISLESFLSQEL